MSHTIARAGQCHCGAVHFEAALSDDFNSILRCTCSYCRMRGAVVAFAEMGGVILLRGEDVLTSYRFIRDRRSISSALAAEFTCIINDDLTQAYTA